MHLILNMWITCHRYKIPHIQVGGKRKSTDICAFRQESEISANIDCMINLETRFWRRSSMDPDSPTEEPMLRDNASANPDMSVMEL